MSNLTVSQGTAGFMNPQTLSEAMELANVMSKSSIVPKDYQGGPGNILVAIQWGAEIGLAPLQAMQNIAVINGRPSIWGDAMLALVRGSGLLESIEEEPTDDGCVCTVKRRGEKQVVREFTKADAKTAGLLGKQGPWQTAPKRMMQMRARAFALRDVFPDVLRGVHIAEEAQDMPQEKDMGEAEVVDKKMAKPSRKDAAMKALKNNASPTVPAVVIGDLVKEIEQATTPDALQEAAQKAASLTTDADKETARAAYQARVKELKEQAAQNTPDADGVVDDKSPANVADMIQALTKASTTDQLDQLMDSMRDMSLTTDEYKAMRSAYDKRLGELEDIPY